MSTRIASFAICFSLVFLAESTSAQSGFSSSFRGAGISRSDFGGGGSSFGSSSFGTSSFDLGMSSFGSGGFGTSDFGSGGFGGGGSLGGFGPASGFGTNVRNFFQRMQGNQSNFFDGFSQRRRSQRSQRSSPSQSVDNTMPPVRVRLNMGYDSPVLTPSSANLTDLTRLNEIAIRGGLDNADVQIEGRTAIVRGVVDSPETARLIMRAVRMEPGVSEVRNEMVFADSLPPSDSP